jgi:hypothetical protein
MNPSPLLYFIAEREAIRRRRVAGEPPPFTDDPILREWSFTNVRREDDRVTKWITKNWREPHADDPDLFFELAVARFVNWPDTLAEIGYPVPWNPEHFLTVMAARAERGDQLAGPAYMIRADNKNPGRITAEYQATEVFKPLWRARKERPTPGLSLARYFARLSDFHGMGGGFMSGQVIADLKFVEPLRSASDWMSFAVSGPGSRRGLNRILGRPLNAPRSETAWRTAFDRLRAAIAPDLERFGLRDLSASSPSSKEPRIVVFRYFDVELPSQIFDRDRDREPGRSLQDQRDEGRVTPRLFRPSPTGTGPSRFRLFSPGKLPS